MHVRICAATIGLSISTAAAAVAQLPATPRALGMAGAYLAMARGQEVLFENPANLGLPSNPYWSVALPQASAAEATLGLGLKDLADLRNYDEFSQARRDEILAQIPNGTGYDIDTRVPILTASVRRFAFGASYNLSTDHRIARDIVDLFLNGYDVNRAAARDYRFDDTQGRRASYADFAAAYGRRVGPVSVGATAHYYLGRSLTSARLDPRARYCSTPAPQGTPCVDGPIPQDVNLDYYSLRASGGSGFGLDIGAAYQPLPNLTLSAAVANLASSMRWSDDLRYRLITLSRQDFENADFNTLSDRYQQERDYDASAPAKVRDLEAGLYEGAEFSPVLKLGAAYEAPTRTTISAAFQNRTGDSRLQGLWARQISVGVQQRLPVVTLRAGAAAGDDGGSVLSAGLSLGPLQLGAGRLDLGAENGVERKGWVATFGLATRTSTVMP